jgi:cyclase
MRSSKTVNRSVKCRITYWPVTAAIGFVLCSAGASFAAEPDSGGLDVVQVRPNFFMIAGAGGNVGVQIGVDGVVLVDAGSGGASDQVLAAIQKLTKLPTRYIINTGADADHVSGNGKLA